MYLMKSAIFCHWLVYFGKTSRLTLKPSSVKKIKSLFVSFSDTVLSINRSIFYMPSGHLVINCLREIFCSIQSCTFTPSLTPRGSRYWHKPVRLWLLYTGSNPSRLVTWQFLRKVLFLAFSPFFYFILFLLTKLLCIGFNIWYIKVVDPSFELKQRTISGVTKVKRRLDKTKITGNFNLPPRRLQSGSLKPLGRPMTASGPLMRNCQGIVAGRSIGHVCPVLRAL